VALVTGASSGIGRAIAVALAADGAVVHLASRSRDRLAQVAEEIGPDRAFVWPTNLLLEDEVTALGDSVAGESNRLDILVHSAGLFRHGRMGDASLRDLDDHMAVNLRAPYQLTQALAPLLVRGQGDVVFINSSVTRGARSEVAHYGASKYALEGLAESLRDEFNPKGVRVLSVYPGRTASPLQERIHEMEGRPYRPELLMQPEDMAQTVLNAVTLPRTAEITEIRVRPMRKT
jgi:NAD(P)-dependent dehydrogenase (short-subunit alcohol dehydrogenase family)